MNPTKQQIEVLKEKCPTCLGEKYSYIPETDEEWLCPSCSGTGQATIEIEKEWIECPDCKGKEEPSPCKTCGFEGEVPKFKVGDEIEIIFKEHNHSFFRDDLGECHNPLLGCWCCKCLANYCKCDCHKLNVKEVEVIAKLKILSETEDKYKGTMVN